jgi:hypothetical protein
MPGVPASGARSGIVQLPRQPGDNRAQSGVAGGNEIGAETQSERLDTNPSARKEERIPVLILNIDRDGFGRRSLEIPVRRFFLVLRNGTGLRDLAVSFDRVSGEKIKDVSLQSRRMRTATLMDLGPGSYKLSAVNHPDWTFEITIK